MKKAVLIAAALVLAPLPLASQEVQDKKDRDPAYAGKGGEQVGTSGRVDDQAQSALRERVQGHVRRGAYCNVHAGPRRPDK